MLIMNQAPAAALRAQRSKDTLHPDQSGGKVSAETNKGAGDGSVNSNKLSGPPPRRPQRPHSYIIDVVIMFLPFRSGHTDPTS
jgi:hypothetical protein